MQFDGFSAIEIQNTFLENYGSLDEQAILEINDNNPNGDINNVVVGLCNHCFGIWLIDNIDKISYQLFYINGHQKLEGDFIQLSLDTKNRDYITFYFSNFIASNYEGVDPVNAFNTYQSHFRSMLEKVGYTTIDNTTFDKFEDPVFFLPGKRGVIKINFLDRLSIYRDLFDNPTIEYREDADYVYLMLNKRNNYVKIGRSKRPNFREKTLQSDEPDIELITVWEAPPYIERELHKKFSDKRKRGEWFELSFSDMKTIKMFMKSY